MITQRSLVLPAFAVILALQCLAWHTAGGAPAHLALTQAWLYSSAGMLALAARPWRHPVVILSAALAALAGTAAGALDAASTLAPGATGWGAASYLLILGAAITSFLFHAAMEALAHWLATDSSSEPLSRRHAQLRREHA